MQYQVKTIKKVGVGAYEDEINKAIGAMASDGWAVQQMLGSPDQGVIILFKKEG